MTIFSLNPMWLLLGQLTTEGLFLADSSLDFAPYTKVPALLHCDSPLFLILTPIMKWWVAVLLRKHWPTSRIPWILSLISQCHLWWRYKLLHTYRHTMTHTCTLKHHNEGAAKYFGAFILKLKCRTLVSKLTGFPRTQVAKGARTRSRPKGLCVLLSWRPESKLWILSLQCKENPEHLGWLRRTEK